VLELLTIAVVLLPAVRSPSLICDNSSVMATDESTKAAGDCNKLKKFTSSAEPHPHIQGGVFFVCLGFLLFTQSNQYCGELGVSEVISVDYTNTAVVCLFVRKYPRKKLCGLYTGLGGITFCSMFAIISS